MLTAVSPISTSPRRIFYLGVRALVLAIACFYANQLFAQAMETWPQWRGPDGTARSKSVDLLKDWETRQPVLLWQAEGLGSGYAGISISREMIFTTGNFEDGQSVVALDRDKGTLIWRKPVTEEVPEHGIAGSRCTPTFSDGWLYVVSSDGQIACLHANDGTIKWQKSFEKEWDGKMMSGWGFSESPLVDGDQVMCTPGGPDAAVVALNKTTGDETWKCKVPIIGDGKNHQGTRLNVSAGYCSMAISNACGIKQYVQLLGHCIVGIRAKDGKLLWSSDEAASNIANISTPIISDDFVFYSTSYGAGSELLKLTPTANGVAARQVYFLEPEVLQNNHGGMILIDDHIYLGHKKSSGFPVCVEMKTGKIRWGGKIRGEGSGSAAVAYADGNLIFRYEDGLVVLIEATPEDYRVKGTFTPIYQKGTSWSHPIVVGKRLYLREQGKLMCYDLSN